MHLYVSFFMIFFLLSCQKEFHYESRANLILTPQEEKGKLIYHTHCILCHNPDPRIEGTIGPALYGSSLELLEARVLTRGYPEGYRPKKDSEIMPDFPELKENITEIKAYLDSF